MTRHKTSIFSPNGKQLRPKGLYRSASGLFWEYWAGQKDYSIYPMREKCLSLSDLHGARKLTDSYFRPPWSGIRPDGRSHRTGRRLSSGRSGVKAFCRPKVRPPFDTRLATGLRGNGKPLLSFCDRFESQTHDAEHEKTPKGVFFLLGASQTSVMMDFVNSSKLASVKS